VSTAVQVIDDSIAYIEEYGFNPNTFGVAQKPGCFIGTFNKILGAHCDSRFHPMLREILVEFDQLAGPEYTHPGDTLGVPTERYAYRCSRSSERAVAVLRELRLRFDPEGSPSVKPAAKPTPTPAAVRPTMMSGVRPTPQPTTEVPPVQVWETPRELIYN